LCSSQGRFFTWKETQGAFDWEILDFGFWILDFGFPNKTRKPKIDFDQPKSFSKTDFIKRKKILIKPKNGFRPAEILFQEGISIKGP